MGPALTVHLLSGDGDSTIGLWRLYHFEDYPT